jgi:hypothetical protein
MVPRRLARVKHPRRNPRNIVSNIPMNNFCAKEIRSFTLLDTMMTNRYVECGEVFARIPRGGPGSIVLLWALLH